MNISTRKMLDKSFTTLSYSSLVVMVFAVLIFLFPIVINGIGAFIFKATVEHDKFLCENLDYYLSNSIREEILSTDKARLPLYTMMDEFESPSNAQSIEKSIEKDREESFERILAENKKLFDILISDNTKKSDEIRVIIKSIWGNYVSRINEMTRISLVDGTSFALAKILESENNAITISSKQLISKMESMYKLSFSQRSILRRSILEYVSYEIKKCEEILSSSNQAYLTFKKGVRELLGPQNNIDKQKSNLMRQRYGQPRMNLVQEVLEKDILRIRVNRTGENGNQYYEKVNSLEYFKNTKVEDMIYYIEDHLDEMLSPHWTFYFGFFTDDPYDSNIFGGIFPMILGTFYLTLGAMIIAGPLGIVAAIYFSEYARNGKIVGLLRMCVGTLAGVPSIVFGLFGLAFLINTVKISESKSVLAGSVTLALLILPTIIRSCEEALKAVPNSYREASLGLGASKWKSICSVILPAALPSMFTGIIISMGRAAGETAPIIFTAATSTGVALGIGEVFSQPTPALPWNIYNICSEHEMAERVVHVQYGMVLTLIFIVLSLNFGAIYMRAKLSKRMKS